MFKTPVSPRKKKEARGGGGGGGVWERKKEVGIHS